VRFLVVVKALCRHRLAIGAAEFLLFLAAALYSVWPLPAEFGTSLPLGTEAVATVPLFNLWTLAWNADRLTHGFSGYWNAPIFYPTQSTFAFSEPQPVSLVVAPVVWLRETPIAAYNTYLVLSLAMNGWMAARLIRQVTANYWAGLTGGAAMVMLPFIHWQLGVLQLIPIWGVLWVIGAMRRFSQEPGIVSGLSWGAALAITYLSCAYHGLFLIVVLIGSGWWWMGRNLFHWRVPLQIIPGVALCLVLVAPVLQQQRVVMREFAFTRPADMITSLSADLGDYTSTPWRQTLPIRDFADPARRPYWHLGPGYIKLLLAVTGIIVGLIDRRLRRWTLFGITFVTVAVLLSLGLRLKIGTWVPYQILIDWFPGMAQARNVFRFALFAQIMIVLLAAQGLEILSPERWRECWQWRCRRAAARAGNAALIEPAPIPRPWWFWQVAVTILVGGAAALEIRPAPQSLLSLPSLELNLGWIDWLKQNTESADVIACVPFPHGYSVEDYQGTAYWMYWALFHRRPMVNGYSGFFPDKYLTLKDKMEKFPDEASVRDLWVLGTRYVVLHRHNIDRRPWRRLVVKYATRLRRVYWDPNVEIGIFELTEDPAIAAPSEPAASPQSDTPD